MTPVENKPNIQLNLSPTQYPGAGQSPQLLAGSKGVIIAIIIGIIAIVIGVSALIGFKSSNQYQGYLKKVEQQTQDLTVPLTKD